jgi:hypothetical membrane protein
MSFVREVIVTGSEVLPIYIMSELTEKGTMGNVRSMVTKLFLLTSWQDWFELLVEALSDLCSAMRTKLI